MGGCRRGFVRAILDWCHVHEMSATGRKQTLLVGGVLSHQDDAHSSFSELFIFKAGHHADVRGVAWDSRCRWLHKNIAAACQMKKRPDRDATTLLDARRCLSEFQSVDGGLPCATGSQRGAKSPRFHGSTSLLSGRAAMGLTRHHLRSCKRTMPPTWLERGEPIPQGTISPVVSL